MNQTLENFIIFSEFHYFLIQHQMLRNFIIFQFQVEELHDNYIVQQQMREGECNQTGL